LQQQQQQTAKQERQAEGRRLLALSRQVRDAAAERAALAREAERLAAELAREQQAVSSSKERQADLQSALEEAKAANTERERAVHAWQRRELELLAQHHLATEQQRQELQKQIEAAKTELHAKQDLCADLSAELSTLLQVRGEAREAAEQARERADRRARNASAWRAEAEEARVQAGEARNSALQTASERDAAMALRHADEAEARRQRELLALQQQKAAATAQALRETKERLTTLVEASVAPEAELQRVKAATVAAEQRAGFVASRCDALEARRAMLARDEQRARTQAARQAMQLEREAQWYGRVADVRERKGKRLAAWATAMRREMERRGQELVQFGNIERARWETMARQQRVARLQLAELARQRVAVARTVAADRAALLHQHRRLLQFKLARRHEMRAWLRLNEQAEGAAVEAVKAAKRRASAAAVAAERLQALEGENASADSLALKVFLLRREVTRAVKQRAYNQSRADKWRVRLGLERTAAAAAERWASSASASAARKRWRAEAALREAAREKENAKAGLAAVREELERLGRETAGIEAAKAQAVGRVRAARDGLAGARAAQQTAEAEAREWERALQEVRCGLGEMRDRVVGATARVDGNGGAGGADGGWG
jgi:hypothetical protein